MLMTRTVPPLFPHLVTFGSTVWPQGGKASGGRVWISGEYRKQASERVIVLNVLRVN